jgi:hypothetical protein
VGQKPEIELPVTDAEEIFAIVSYCIESFSSIEKRSRRQNVPFCHLEEAKHAPGNPFVEWLYLVKNDTPPLDALPDSQTITGYAFYRRELASYTLQLVNTQEQEVWYPGVIIVVHNDILTSAIGNGLVHKATLRETLRDSTVDDCNSPSELLLILTKQTVNVGSLTSTS